MRFARSPIWLAVASLALTACGGGGGGGGGGGFSGGGNSGFIRSSVPYETPRRVDTYSPYSSASYTATVTDIFTKDLNADNVDEVVIAGRQTAQPSVTTHVNYNLQIYGFNNAAKTLANETSSWFAAGANTIAGTEPSVKFADFNGDGRPDMFVAAGNDMQSLAGGQSSLFVNAGNRFNRVNLNLGSSIWSHDTAIADFNGDGVPDALVSDYNASPALVLGSKTNNFTVLQGTGISLHSSGIAAADFLGNNTQTVIMTDSEMTGNSDAGLYSVNLSGSGFSMTKIASLPSSRFNLAKYSGTGLSGDGHELRVLSFDFDHSGRPGAVVISSKSAPGSSQVYTEIQFLKNNGGGNFTDVTDTVLRNYNTQKSPTYQPQLIDVNNDGLVDIYISGVDYTGKASTSVLVQTKEGYFTEQYANVFSDFSSQIRNAAQGSLSGGWVHGGNQEAINIVTGPDNTRYLISTVQFLNGEGNNQTSVYLAKIGTTGTITPQASIAAIQQTWPWMSTAQANEVLAKTAQTNFAGYDPAIHGNGIIDLDAALRPIGVLGVMTKKGAIQPLVGGISIPGFDSSKLTNVAAVDSMGRNFNVNLSTTAGKPMGMPISYSAVSRPGDNYSSKFTGGYFVNRWGGWTMDGGVTKNPDGTDSMNYTTGISSRIFNPWSSWEVNTTITQMQGSPWFNFYGMYGQVRSSTIIDSSLTKHYGYGFWSQHGVMQTATDFNAGLVSKITPLYSAYNMGGWRNHEWSVYTGMQPYHIGGNVQVSLPSSIDMNGNMQYSQHNVGIRNTAVGFAGIERRWQGRNHSVSMFAVANTQNQQQIAVNYIWSY